MHGGKIDHFSLYSYYVVAGLVLAMPHVLTGSLAVPIGIHITWNLFKGSVYGVGVSGLRLPVTVVETEAGLLGAGAVVVGSAAILWWVRWQGGETRIHESLTKPDLRSDPEG